MLAAAMGVRITTPRAALAALWLALSAVCAEQARAECVAPPAPMALPPPASASELAGVAASASGPSLDAAAVDAVIGPTRDDGLGRVVAPVWVNGEGPFRFIIDTGANRTVLSVRLAARLGLAPSASGAVHTIDGVQIAPLVNVASVSYGPLSIAAGELPLLQGPVLAGEHGLLGVDGMAGRRLHMDLEHDCIEIAPASQARRLRGWARVEGELRFGHLVILRGKIGRIDVNVLVDTGSDTSLANVALRDALALRWRHQDRPPARAYTAAGPVVLEWAVGIHRLSLDDVEIRNVGAYVGDFHIFDVWGLKHEPTLLIGMDVISQARAIAIDYERATVHFRLPRRPRIGPRAPDSAPR